MTEKKMDINMGTRTGRFSSKEPNQASLPRADVTDISTNVEEVRVSQDYHPAMYGEQEDPDEVLEDLLGLVVEEHIVRDKFCTLTSEERKELEEWAAAEHAYASDNTDVERKLRPLCLHKVVLYSGSTVHLPVLSLDFRRRRVATLLRYEREGSKYLPCFRLGEVVYRPQTRDDLTGMEVIKTATYYPEHEKMRGVKEQSQAIGNFLEWLGGTDMRLGEWDRNGSDLRLTNRSTEQILSMYLEISLNEISREKDHMYAELVRDNEERAKNA